MGGFSHDAVFNVVHMEKVSVIFSKISFIGIGLLNEILGMARAGNKQGETGAIMKGSERYLRGQDKPITGINRSMFFESIMRDIIFNRPVRLQITREFERIFRFIHFPFGRFSALSFFLQLLLAARMAGRLDQAGINGYALVNG